VKKIFQSFLLVVVALLVAPIARIGASKIDASSFIEGFAEDHGRLLKKSKSKSKIKKSKAPKPKPVPAPAPKPAPAPVPVPVLPACATSTTNPCVTTAADLLAALQAAAGGVAVPTTINVCGSFTTTIDPALFYGLLDGAAGADPLTVTNCVGTSFIAVVDGAVGINFSIALTPAAVFNP
jgi:hypothetical protein